MEVVAKFTLSEAMNHRNLEIFKPLFGKILNQIMDVASKHKFEAKANLKLYLQHILEYAFYHQSSPA